ncbi:hypothetical protein B0H34DRAFT_349977 [Crassisporium funariophilum]|nr:hypothetical protein B0H34DRAFT_349977 [Crassisporium funariophilum]
MQLYSHIETKPRIIDPDSCHPSRWIRCLDSILKEQVPCLWKCPCDRWQETGFQVSSISMKMHFNKLRMIKAFKRVDEIAGDLLQYTRDHYTRQKRTNLTQFNPFPTRPRPTRTRFEVNRSCNICHEEGIIRKAWSSLERLGTQHASSASQELALVEAT